MTTKADQAWKKIKVLLREGHTEKAKKVLVEYLEQDEKALLPGYRDWCDMADEISCHVRQRCGCDEEAQDNAEMNYWAWLRGQIKRIECDRNQQYHEAHTLFQQGVLLSKSDLDCAFRTLEEAYCQDCARTAQEDKDLKERRLPPLLQGGAYRVLCILERVIDALSSRQRRQKKKRRNQVTQPGEQERRVLQEAIRRFYVAYNNMNWCPNCASVNKALAHLIKHKKLLNVAKARYREILCIPSGCKVATVTLCGSLMECVQISGEKTGTKLSPLFRKMHDVILKFRDTIHPGYEARAHYPLIPALAQIVRVATERAILEEAELNPEH